MAGKVVHDKYYGTIYTEKVDGRKLYDLYTIAFSFFLLKLNFFKN